MKRETDLKQLNTRQLEMHLRSAVDALTPDVLNRIDLSIPQERALGQEAHRQTAVWHLQRRVRRFAATAAACVCLLLIGGGGFHYHLENRRVESVIGIDVNPSVELSINRKEKVLEVRALNAEAEDIMADMDLEGVDLNVAVNAVVGAMVTHGYLKDLDNAILVTVSNDSVRKAKELRSSVVEDIEQTLKENQVEAVVYDQQVIEDEEMEALAQTYGISYGKAYFLKELIDQNPDLDMEDMEEMSSMTMEEIAQRITESSYELGELADLAKEPEETKPETSEAVETLPEETETVTEPETQETATEPETSQAAATEPETAATEPETTKAPTISEEEEEEEISGSPVEIDYVDYDNGMVYVYFTDRVKWKNPSVVVRDEEGNSYAAMVDETSRRDCTFEVDGLEGGKNYVFVLGGLCPAGSDNYTTVKGYFEKPDIAPELDQDLDLDDKEEEGEEKASHSKEQEIKEPSEAASESESLTEQETEFVLDETKEAAEKEKPKETEEGKGSEEEGSKKSQSESEDQAGGETEK